MSLIFKFKRKIFNFTQFKDVISNSFWNILASIILRGNIFIVNIIIARLIGTELFGKYALIKSTIQVFEVSLGIAFGLSMTKYISEFRYSSNQKKSNLLKIVRTNIFSSLILSLLLFIILESSSKYIAFNILKNIELLSLFKISVYYLLFNNISQCFIGILKGEEKFRKIFLLSLITGILNLVLVLVLTLYFSLNGAIYALVIFSIFQLIAFLIVSFKETSYLKLNNWKKPLFDFKVIRNFTLPAIISGLAAPPAIWIINVNLSRIELGYQELAYFNAAYQIFALIVFLPISISDATFPILNKYLGNFKMLEKFFLGNFILILIISFLISIIPFFFPELVISIFGKDFIGAASSLKYLSIAAIFSSLLTFLGKVLATFNKMWVNMTFNYFWAAIVIIFSLVFIEEGAKGIAKAFLYSYSILFFFQFLYVTYSIKRKK